MTWGSGWTRARWRRDATPASCAGCSTSAASSTDGASEGMLRGPTAQWVDELTTLVVEHGFDTFILWTETPGQLPPFAEEVVPAVRAQVASERPPRS